MCNACTMVYVKDPRKAAVDATDDVANRMLRSLQLSGLSVQEIAQWLECSRNTVGNWLNRRTPPSPQSIRLWAHKTDVPYEWLKDGDGHWPKGWTSTKEQVSSG